MEIIDIHTHCFPDFLAEKALHSLIKKPGKVGSRAYHNGTIGGLLASMENAGITKSVIQSVATRPEQVKNILEWSIKIKSSQFEPFISIHPDYTGYKDILKKAKDNGIRGIKVHPHYQGFTADDEKLFPLYESFCEYGFIVLFHSGDDFAFPGQDNASVLRMKNIIRRFPQMRIILAHFGAYREWDEVYTQLAGEDVFLDTSFVLREAGRGMFLKILKKHSEDKLLFGTDSPWLDQKKEVEMLKRAQISDELKEKIFFRNYYNLLGA